MLYSIGHGNRSWAEFSKIIKEHNGRYIIDVRSFPKSKFNPDFDKENLEKHCQNDGIKYLFWGDSLGGRPKGKHLYDKDGKADYNLMSQEADYQSSIQRLIKASSLEESVFIMCSELCPSQCHRSKLIGKTLDSIGIKAIHIDKKGKEISQQEVIDIITDGQDDLFGENPAISRSRGSYA